MKKKIILPLVIGIILLMSVFAARSCSAQNYISVNINSDGSVEPANAPIQQVGDTYILTGDVGSISVEKSNIVLDGNGHVLPGQVSIIDGLEIT